ncbi:hypothetical protein [Natronococcus wangiae]|uniref:hypothetical protein n=1 Tax=Natronococcus wangiae TaxID=3068275 RepID=UPI00273F98E8|nr:hypothetical protein [Natronococcus sp. AD5]
MTDEKSIQRLEETDDGMRVVTKGLSDLYDYRFANVLEQEYWDLFTLTIPVKGDPKRVWVVSAAHIGESEGWKLHGANGIGPRSPSRCASSPMPNESGVRKRSPTVTSSPSASSRSSITGEQSY